MPLNSENTVQICYLKRNITGLSIILPAATRTANKDLVFNERELLYKKRRDVG